MRPLKTPRTLAEKLSWLIASILVLLPFHALLSTWVGSNFGYPDGWRVWKEIIFFAMLPFAAWLVWHSELKKWFVESWIVRLFGLYILLHAVLGAWAYSRHQVNRSALLYAFIINLRFVAFFILCTAVCANSDFLKLHWRKILLIPAAAVVGFGLIQKLFLPYDFLRHFGYGKGTIAAYQTVDSNLDYRRIQSTLRGANPLGAYLVLLIPAFWTSVKKRWLKYLIVIAAGIVLFFTYSRSAEIGTTISIGLVIWWGLAKKISSRRVVGLVLVLVIVVAGVLYVFRNSRTVQDTFFHTSDSSTSSRSSNADRLQAMKNGARDIIHQPLGAGPGTAGPASVRNDHPARIAENYFLQIGQEVGVVGMVLFIAINVLVIKQLWERRADVLARILLAALAGLTFVNLLSHAWADDTISYLWWGLAGVALTPILKLKHNEKEH